MCEFLAYSEIALLKRFELRCKKIKAPTKFVEAILSNPTMAKPVVF